MSLSRSSSKAKAASPSSADFEAQVDVAEKRHATEAADLTSAGFDLTAYNNSLNAERPSLVRTSSPSSDDGGAPAENLVPVALDSPGAVLAESSTSTFAPKCSSSDPLTPARSISHTIAEDPFEDKWVPASTSTVTPYLQVDNSATEVRRNPHSIAQTASEEETIAAESPTPIATSPPSTATAAPDEATSSPFDLVIMPKRRAEDEQARPAGALASAPVETTVKIKGRKLRKTKPKDATSEEASHRTKRQKRIDAAAAAVPDSSSDDDASVNTDQSLEVAALRFRCESLAKNNAALAKENTTLRKRVSELKGCEDKALELETAWMGLGRRIEILEAEAEELEAAKDVLEEELQRLRATSE
ncbi:uncharacterized protein AB675_10576 [Cyphellophora attinorum]|uniref:Uncharacterized protein n=1 Tax=Cyphellophora attinorum TaxID=1664694 RepID=A0A0N1HA55_9EURO|nr:uncharacterized protein AB675_10576 [Phialophora attinorum]KPI40637.1 hypothetical protein AB675_10576 [Phialophora attinorum]